MDVSDFPPPFVTPRFSWSGIPLVFYTHVHSTSSPRPSFCLWERYRHLEGRFPEFVDGRGMGRHLGEGRTGKLEKCGRDGGPERARGREGGGEGDVIALLG